MAQYSASGDVFTPSAVRSGASPFSFSIAAGTGTGAIAGSVVDNGALYPGYLAQVVGNASVTAGAVKLQGSLDGVNWYDLTAATTIPTTAANTALQGYPTSAQEATQNLITGSRFMRLNVTTATTGAAATVLYGGV